MADHVDTLNEQIIRYNRQFHEVDASNALGWKISKSQIAGRGLVATKRYSPGDVIFVDHPLVVGPRFIPDLKPFCVICWGIENLKSCSRQCRLPVCSTECENDEKHAAECDYLSALTDKEGTAEGMSWDSNRFKVLTVIRCLTFDELAGDITASLHKIRGRQRNEVNLLKNCTKTKLKPEDEHFMQFCCRVLNANAFEILLPTSRPNREEVALRGLYPTASILNHSCTPNTTHHFKEDCKMVVKASNVILPGCEITSTYSPLLLGTAARRSFLALSKEFHCTCLRCKDPSEYGTYLSAIKCRNATCDPVGLMLPIEPLNFHSSWQCIQCKSILTANKIAILQKAIAGELSRFDTKEPKQIIDFINGERFATSTNHTIIQFKYVLLKQLGNAQGYEYSELSEDLLQLKRQICEEILTIVSQLSLGQCEIKGTCLHELAMTNHEIKKRNGEV